MLVREDLPGDVETLKDLVLALDAQVDRLVQEVGRLRRWQFGPKSERVPEGQGIFEFLGTIAPEPERPAAAPAPRKPRRRPHGHHVIPPDLPKQEIEIDLPAAQRGCPDCGRGRDRIGWEMQRRLDWTPASFVEQILKRAKYACRECQGQVVAAKAPEGFAVWDRGLPGPGLLAQVIVGKYSDHLPLYRQAGIYARHGARLPVSTLDGWVLRAAELVRPIVDAMIRDVLAGGIVQTDDTVVRLLIKGRGRTAQARLWGYLGDAAHRQVVYEFSPNRSSAHPKTFLKDYRSLLQADAYGGYDALFEDGTRMELGCMAHCRRYFFEARDADRERADRAIAFIRALYDVEDDARGRPPAEILALRQARSKPLLGDFRAWLDRESLKLLPSSPMAEAFRYALNQWAALGRYVDVPEASIDNNAMERELRPVAVGRKNFLFVVGATGGPAAATHYSLIQSCRLNGLDPWRYLKDVLGRLSTHPMSRVAELMPRLWKPPPAAS